MPAPATPPPSVPPSGQLIVTSPWQLLAGQSLLIRDANPSYYGYIRLEAAGLSSPPTVTIAGTYLGEGTTPYGVMGFSVLGSISYDPATYSQVTIAPAGKVYVHATGGYPNSNNGANADGAYLIGSTVFTNNGLLQVVSDNAQAWGIVTIDGVVTFKNSSTGILRVYGAGHSTGTNSGTNVENAGVIEVTGETSLYYGSGAIALQDPLTLVNSGTIRATAPGGVAVGVYVEFGSFGQAYVNSGTIEAQYAFYQASINLQGQDWADVKINNSGTIHGAIALGPGAHDIRNTGTIDGVISFGDKNAIYNGAGGRLLFPLYLGHAANTVTLGDFGETVQGGGGSDTITGGAGDDVIDIDGGTNAINGGGGFDTLILASAATPVSVNLQSGVMTAPGSSTVANIDYVVGSNFNDQLTGGGVGEVLDGGAGDDSLAGGGGDDLLIAGVGDDRIDGGPGRDIASYLDVGSVTVSLAVAGAQAVGSGAGSDTLISIEGLEGSDFADSLTGDGADNSLYGNAGADTLSGGGGGDELDGGADDDVIDGGAGFNTASYAWAGSGVVVNLAAAGAQAVGGGQGSDTLMNIQGLIGSDFADTLSGDAGSNELIGGAGGDALLGSGGADTLAGLGGNDSLGGGAGLDAAVYVGARSNFVVSTYESGGSLYTRVTDQASAEGADTISGVETLGFGASALGLFTPFALAGIQQNHLAVMDAGRFDDVILQSAASGKMVYADLDGTAGGAGLKTILGALPAGWKVVGSGDFTGDGRAEALIQNTNNGSIYTYGTSGWGVVSQSLTSDWQTRGVGDFTGDGTLDVLIRNSVTGQVVFAEMNGPTFGSWALGANVGTGWATIGVGDFDKDGYSDQLVQDLTTGTVLYANFDAGVQNGWGLVTGGLPPEWVAKEAVDLNGDGYFDVVFQNTSTGQVFYVNMAGGTNSGWGVVATVPGWNVVGSGDYDNDGYGDVLIRNTSSGQLIYANMDNGAFQGWGVVTGAAGTDWVAA